MEIEEVRTRLVNKFCDQLKSTQEFSDVTKDLMESIEKLDYIMLEHFNMVYNPNMFKYQKLNSNE